MKEIATFTVSQVGIGKPDYSREISAGQHRAGVSLKYGQLFKYLAATFTDEVAVPYINPTVVAPLAAGASAHLIDPETGIAGPVTIPEGYIAYLLQWEWTGNERIEMWHYIDTILIGCAGISDFGANYGWNMVVPPSTLDFGALTSHDWDVEVNNVGVGLFQGTIDFIFLCDPVGTKPLPPTKLCRCPFCKHEQRMPRETTRAICQKCSKLYILRDLSSFRRTP